MTTTPSRDELCRLLAVKCYDTVSAMHSMKVSKQQREMFKLYHGDDGDGVRHIDLLCKGLDPDL